VRARHRELKFTGTSRLIWPGVVWVNAMLLATTLLTPLGSESAESPYDPHGICTEDGGDLQELDHVEPALATLVFGHKRLRSAKAIGHILLGQTGFLPCGNKQLAQSGVLGRSDRLAHAGRHEPQQLIPGPDYPK
jgi:hypothetical protein